MVHAAERNDVLDAIALAPCPVGTVIRRPADGATDRFTALSGCREQLRPDAPVGDDAPRPSVRIPGEADAKERTDLVDAGPTPAPVAHRSGMPALAPAALFAMRPRSYATRFDTLIGDVAQRHRIDPLLLHAVVKQESTYRPQAVSHAGAIGLMQIMPGTGRGLGYQPAHLTQPQHNVEAGARLLRRLHARYGGNFDLVLAAYNAGEGAVARYGNRIPPFRETQDYVRRVKAHYRALAAENGVAAGF